jgi:hypothetical protein
MVKRKSNGALNGHDAGDASTARSKAASDSFVDQLEQPLRARRPASQRHNQTGTLIARGKDVLSGEAGGVAAVLAIGVGAALIEIELIPGLIIGAGAILLGKLFPQMGSYVRPAVKNVVRAGFAASQKARDVIAEASEQVHDMVAEVKHEQAIEPKPVKKRRPARKVTAAASSLPVH